MQMKLFGLNETKLFHFSWDIKGDSNHNDRYVLSERAL